MPVKRAIVAAVAALAITGGAALAATPARAETPSCGASCIDFYGGIPAILGAASFIMASYREGDVTGTPLILSEISNANPAEDFTDSDDGPVSEFVQAGLISTSVGDIYGDDIAYEFQYSPFGAPTGECVGVGATATSGEKVTLQPCGVSGKTLWIVDTPRSGSITGSQYPLINGSTQNGATPFVLTYPLGASPEDQPNPGMFLSNLQENAAGQVPYNQSWSAFRGTARYSDASLTFATPPSITTDATSPSGATVTYPLPPATDIDGTTPTVTCKPASGSLFPIGTTTVTCTATDDSELNSPVQATFTVTVLGAAAQLTALQEAVSGFGFYNIPALLAGIAAQELSTGHPLLACQTLNQFITDVRAQVPAATAATLIADAERIQAVLGGCATRPPLT
jgi:hypothetical protein